LTSKHLEQFACLVIEGLALESFRRLGELPGLSRKAPRKAYPPGQHGQARKKKTEYAIRLEEKQKLRFNYGVSEKQLVRYVKKSTACRWFYWFSNFATAGDAPRQYRIFRLGFAPTIPSARQLVNHGHITINGRVLGHC
jgi:small subunit ribosomal protein S4